MVYTSWQSEFNTAPWQTWLGFIPSLNEAWKVWGFLSLCLPVCETDMVAAARAQDFFWVFYITIMETMEAFLCYWGHGRYLIMELCIVLPVNYLGSDCHHPFHVLRSHLLNPHHHYRILRAYSLSKGWVSPAPQKACHRQQSPRKSTARKLSALQRRNPLQNICKDSKTMFPTSAWPAAGLTKTCTLKKKDISIDSTGR